VQEASIVLNLAVPPRSEDAPGGPWRLSALEINNPSRFCLRTAAFDGRSRSQAVVEHDKVQAFALHSDALTVTAQKG
jgi:hypothetical protein